MKYERSNKVRSPQRYMARVLILLVMLVGPMRVAVAGENNSIFQQAYTAKQAMTGRTNPIFGKGGRGDRRNSMGYKGTVTAVEASWITVDVPRQKDYRVHDFVTIIINEVSRSRTKAKSKLERENSIEAILEDWIRLESGRLRPDAQRGGNPAVVAGIEREFKGKGETDRQDMLTARITAEIIDVLPNGNLVLEATKSVTTDEDVTRITLTGMCRSSDIGADNTIISSKLARMDISKTHSGAAYGATKRGFLHRLFDTISPF